MNEEITEVHINVINNVVVLINFELNGFLFFNLYIFRLFKTMSLHQRGINVEILR